MAKIDLAKFLADPAAQDEREFLDGYFDDFLKRKAIKEKEERDKNPGGGKTLLQRLFDPD